MMCRRNITMLPKRRKSWKRRIHKVSFYVFFVYFLLFSNIHESMSLLDCELLTVCGKKMIARIFCSRISLGNNIFRYISWSFSWLFKYLLKNAWYCHFSLCPLCGCWFQGSYQCSAEAAFHHSEAITEKE